MHVFAFDIETVPDVELGRRMYGHAALAVLNAPQL